MKRLYPHHHQSVLPKDRSFTANSGTKAAVLNKGRSSTGNKRTQVAVLLESRSSNKAGPHYLTMDAQ